MFKIKKLSVGLLLLMFMLLFSSHKNLDSYASVEDTTSQNISINYVSRDYITIDGDSDLDLNPANGIVTGDGSELTPYLIENYAINTVQSYAIYIHSTTVSFTIRNCYLNATNSGIYISGTSSGKLKIYNNTVVDHEDQGILVSEFPDCEIYNNTVVLSSSNGIRVTNSDNCHIYDNICQSNHASGIYVGSSHNSLIEDNYGRYNDYAVDVWFSNNATIRNNDGYDSSFEGIRLFGTSSSYIYNNDIFRSASYGMSLENSASGNEIYQNNFIDNSVFASQGNDEGTGNIWYNNNTFVGNLWSDWTGGYYDMDGTAGSYDKYPIYNANYIEYLVLSSDSDFETVCTQGNGTALNPYIIRDLVIQTDYTRGISVSYTNLYFVIQNCTIESSSIGIYLKNVLDGTAVIHNNTLLNNDDYGIYLDNASSTIISENYCYNSFHAGIHVESSDSCEITDNFSEDNYWNGIAVIYTDGNTTIQHNTCKGNRDGILALYANDTFIYDNTISDTFYDSIHLWYSTKTTVIGNNCSLGDTGIRNQDCNESLITYNYFDSNDVGLIIGTASYSTTIHHNHFLNSSTAHAIDHGIGSIWYDVSVDEGNWWEGWTGGEVHIMGLAGSIDPFPMGTPVIGEFSSYTSLSLLVFSASILAVIVYRKRK